MIERYSRKEIAKIWEEKNKYQIWLNIEIAAAQAMEKLKLIPKGVASTVRKKAKINVDRIHKIENKVHHDMIAFLSSITEKVGNHGKFLHKGMTSSDVLDTCFNFQLAQASKILKKDIDEILQVLKNKSLRYKNTICVGRSHGIHAEPTTFGLKLASFYEEFKRNKNRLERAVKEISTCAISGAVGNFANVDPRVEAHVAKKMGLKIEPISSQIIPRDRHAYYFSILAIIAGSIERVATEIRNLQKTEVQEVEEFFEKKQKGSSAMPHKKNPILSENLTGLTRMVRSYVIPALENISLWHERDISHSSVERNIGPDSTITLDFALHRLKNILKNMNVYPKKMLENLKITNGLIFSQRVMLELTKNGFSREKAYTIVQKHAQNSWKNNMPLYESLVKDKMVVKKITAINLKKMFDLNYHTKKVNIIFKRIFK
ncbi:MAG: adenylosuccinate lyase [Pelagibacteraceae bacterium]|jgi:adenylosuccinate lyase|nr:adenylosuccinate lyase [Pelagibacteraceae bacterium]